MVNTIFPGVNEDPTDVLISVPRHQYVLKDKSGNITECETPLPTSVKSYPLSILCFSPANMPGVSTSVTVSNTGDRVIEHWNLLRNALPNFDKGLNGVLGSTTKALPIKREI